MLRKAAYFQGYDLILRCPMAHFREIHGHTVLSGWHIVKGRRPVGAAEVTRLPLVGWDGSILALRQRGNPADGDSFEDQTERHG